MKINSLLKTTVLILMLVPTMTAFAKMLNVSANGQKTSVDIAKISKIHFEGSQMVVTHVEGTHQFGLGDIDSIFFDMQTTAIENVSAVLDELSVAINGGVITVNAASDATIKVNVYSLRGLSVAATSGVGTATLDLNTLTPGVYIVKANNKTIKFIR